jgi:hypothetical protein
MREKTLKLRCSIIVMCLCVACCGVTRAQEAAGSPDHASLETAVEQARIQAITPRSTPPAWMDDDKIRLGFEFMKQHDEFIQQILATSSLASTFAAKDITPVLMQTGQLPKNFAQRLKETGRFMNAIMEPHNGRAEFVQANLGQAYQLGRLHAGVAKQMRGILHWNRKERVPMNEQAYGFVLYSFAWWPVEALEATGQIKPEEKGRELDGWFHFWSVVGYEMGVSEKLLPVNYARAREMAVLLRNAQYAHAGEALPDGIPVLLGGHVRWLAAGMAAHSGPGKVTPEQAVPRIAAMFAQVIKLSPGLSEALGLGSGPEAQLIKDASLPAPQN